jgi:hypothetical protein
MQLGIVGGNGAAGKSSGLRLMVGMCRYMYMHREEKKRGKMGRNGKSNLIHMGGACTGFGRRIYHSLVICHPYLPVMKSHVDI